jgi:putative transposase
MMDGDVPAVLLRDRDDKFGPAFDRAARGAGAKVVRTAVRAPNMNAVAERFVGSVRRELLDHMLLVDDLHLASLLRQYQLSFNESRPHQALGQCMPARPVMAIDGPSRWRSRACSAGFT